MLDTPLGADAAADGSAGSSDADQRTHAAQVLADLIAVRELIGVPERWCQGASALREPR